jgi:hypothetical protein
MHLVTELLVLEEIFAIYPMDFSMSHPWKTHARFKI